MRRAHPGQANPEKFSTMPRTIWPICSANPTHFRESSSDTPWGDVTITTPSASGIICATDNGSSPVPGGQSTTRTSVPVQSAWPRNCASTWAFAGPRQITGASADGRYPDTDSTRTPGAAWSGCSASPSASPCIPWSPVISGTSGPWRSASTIPTWKPRAAKA
jgi:hypothetical protein